MQGTYIPTSDVIIVFGKQQADHDDAFRAALQGTRENSLTANPDKYLFNQSSTVFFGHHFSADDKVHLSSTAVSLKV